MFGDILTDEAAGLVGGLGMAPGLCIGRGDIAMAQATHGSAPDIAGKGLANPIATLASFGMALRYSFGLGEVADRLDTAISSVLEEGLRTRDIASPGQNAVSTSEMGSAIIAAMERGAP
jgi:3-isopropylmalate dehydrogenase